MKPPLAPRPSGGKPRPRPDTRTRQERGYTEEYLRNRELVLEANPICDCGQAWTTETDHIIPLSSGGTSEITNLKAYCSKCHRLKHGKWR